MKIILTSEVRGLGSAGDIVEVKDGYARNFLVPRGQAIRWTRGAESQVATLRRSREQREIRDVGQAREVADALAALEVRLPSRAGEGGRLFGSVTAADVVDAVASAGGPKLDRHRVEMPVAHIKTVGTHAVSVRLHPDVVATVDVEVVPVPA